MKLPSQTFFNGLIASVELEESVRRNAEQRERFCADMVHCRVNVLCDDNRKRHGGRFGNQVNLTISDLTLASSTKSNEDGYVALRDAFAHVTNMFEDTFCGYRGLPRTRE